MLAQKSREAAFVRLSSDNNGFHCHEFTFSKKTFSQSQLRCCFAEAGKQTHKNEYRSRRHTAAVFSLLLKLSNIPCENLSLYNSSDNGETINCIQRIVTTNSPETQTNHKHDVKYCLHTQCQARIFTRFQNSRE